MRKALILGSLVMGVATAFASIQTSSHQAIRKGVDPSIVHQKNISAQPSNAAAVYKASPRTDTEVGTSRYDYQHNGSHGKMLAVSADGVVHGAFMGGTDISSGRRVVAWCLGEGDVVTGPTEVLAQHTGYTTSAVTSEAPTNGLAGNSGVVAMHSSVPSSQSWVAVDFAGCTLAFNALTHNQVDVIWPHVAVDNDDRMHIVCGDASTGELEDAVWYSSSADGLGWEQSFIMLTDNSNVLSMTSAAARGAGGAAVFFMQDAPAETDIGDLAPQWHHDIFYYRSDVNDIEAEINDGNMVNVTRYRHPDSSAPLSDGVFAYADVDAIFDSQVDPQLHIAWSAPPVWMDSAYYIDPLDGETYLLEGGTFANVNVSSSLWHFNADTGEYGHIAGWATGVDENDDRPDPGVFRVASDRVQLAVDPDTGYLYAIWNEYFSDDTRDAWDDGLNMPNGEIFAACSADNGLTWGPRVNLTDTQTPGCDVGDCASETFASVAEVAYDGELFISYMLDLHAGASIRNDDANDGSEETVNPWMVMRVPVENIPPHDGTPWDADGHVGLSTYERTWSYTGGHADTAQTLDRVLIFNESNSSVYLDMVEVFHDAIDVFGEFGDPLYAQFDAFNEGANDYFANPDDWDGHVPAWSTNLIRLSVGHIGLPVTEQAFKLTFSDGTVRWYRYVYAETEVVPFDMDNPGNYSSFTLWQRNTDVSEGAVPVSFELGQNFPNPFNPTTEISFSLENNAQATLSVFNLTGQKVATLVDGNLAAGSHQVTFDASGLSSGLYFYTLSANGISETRKMLLSK